MTGLITVRNGGEGCYEEKNPAFLPQHTALKAMNRQLRI